jgi:CRP-like cAMP-binding protein
MLNEILLEHPKMPKELYDKIYLHLEYINLKQKKDKSSLIDSLPHSITKTLLFEMYRPIIENFHFFKNFKNSEFINRVISKLKPIIAVKNDILFDQGEIIEESFFVKQGRLSLEVKIDTIHPEKSVQKLLDEEYFFGVENNELYKKNAFALIKMTSIKPSVLNSSINQKNLYNLYSKKDSFDMNNINKKDMKSILTNNQGKGEVIKHLNDNSNCIYLRILDIRKNEHFGALLMFLNKRSPLSLRVKTKKAELYFLNKKDVLDISTCFPSIWKQIIKKSLFNFEQIKRLMNKIKNIFLSSHGKNNHNANKLINQTNKKFQNSEISQLADLNESELKSIPSFTDLTESILNNINEKSSSSKSSESESSNSILKKNTISNQHISEKSDEQSSSSFIDKNSKNSKISKNSNNSNSSNSKISKNSSNSKITKNTKLSKNTKISKITKNNKMNSKISYDLNAHRNLDYPIIKNTPFLPDDINDEIYPNETFFNGDLNEENKFKRNKTKDLKKRIKKEYNTYKTFIKAYGNDNSNKMNIDTTILNLSICSTEISFTLNSEYENINELSDYKYTKDKKLRAKISNILKGKEDLISKSNSKSSSDSDNKKLNNYTNRKDNFPKIKISPEKRRRQSISFFNSNSQLSKPVFTKFKSNNEKDNNKNIKALTKKEIQKKMNTKENGPTKIKRKSLLITLNQNIERNQINLNNPDLFYQEYFQRIIEENKGKDKDIENLAKNNTKIKSQKSLQNFNINFNKIINQGQT